MIGGKAFDVFLSHNGRDKPAVEVLARRLDDEAQLTPWLDKWNLVPGEPWQEAIEQALDNSRTCAVFIGPSGIGPWENEEMRSALQTRVSQAGFRVVPVLLPGATMPDRGSLPRFLSRLTWVDFRGRDGLDDAEAFHRLVAGIRGMAPGRGGGITYPVPIAIECPYRGLEVFDEAHAPFFFGREAMTQHLVEALRTTRFLAVLGPSGSGKSSLLRAGLLPKLRAGAVPGSEHWAYLSIKPGAHPLQELALQVAGAETAGDVLSRTRCVLDSMQADERSLHLQVRLSLAGRPAEVRWCFLVDQFEEVFSLCQDKPQRIHFIENLRYAATIADGRTIILITMRLDFMPQAAEYTELAEILSGHQFLVSPMDEGDLRRAIEEPARLVGVQFAGGLVDTIIDDVRREPGVLPLLEHALLQLWERRSADQMMTLQAYRESGGVQGALAKRADAIFAAFTPKQQAMTRRLMLRLTQPGEGTEDTRRPAAMRELWTRPDERPAVEQVVEQLATARLLTTSVDATGERQVEVAHEALIRGWPHLRRWIEEDRTALRMHRRITEAAQEWLRMQRDENLLFRGARLAQAEEWREHHEEDVNELEREFLDASIARHVREAEAEQERQWRELAQARALAEEQKHRAEEQARAAKRLRRRAIGLVVVTLLAVGASAFVWIQRERARLDRYYKAKNMGYFPKVSNPLGVGLHLYHVGKTGIKEMEGFDGNGIYLETGDYYLQAKKENWLLKYPIYLQGYNHVAKPIVVQLPTARSIPEDMAYIPEGWFRMGDKEGKGNSNERPPHDIYVDGFMIDRKEVSNRAYKKFVDEGGYQRKEYWTEEGWKWKELPLQGGIATAQRRYWDDEKFTTADAPKVGVTWYEASAYCQWAGKRLPTEAEWEKAARGPEGYSYAFGNANAPSRINSEQPNRYGLCNMIGGVWEWVFDRYDENYYRSSPKRNPRGPDQERHRILRGGSSNAEENFRRAAFRWDLPPDYGSKTAGFRCAKGRHIDAR